MTRKIDKDGVDIGEWGELQNELLKAAVEICANKEKSYQEKMNLTRETLTPAGQTNMDRRITTPTLLTFAAQQAAIAIACNQLDGNDEQRIEAIELLLGHIQSVLGQMGIERRTQKYTVFAKQVGDIVRQFETMEEAPKPRKSTWVRFKEWVSPPKKEEVVDSDSRTTHDLFGDLEDEVNEAVRTSENDEPVETEKVGDEPTRLKPVIAGAPPAKSNGNDTEVSESTEQDDERPCAFPASAS